LEILNVVFSNFKFQFFYFSFIREGGVEVTESSTNKRKHARILLKKIMLQGAELPNEIFLNFEFQFFYFSFIRESGVEVTESSTNKRKHARNRLLLKKNHVPGCRTTGCNFLKF